jgi:mannose-1-phosphate guanylyltransferase
MELLRAHGVSHVLINTHHLPEPVREFAAAHVPPPHLTLVHEPHLLGTAGTVRTNRAFVEHATDFLAAYADNLTQADLSALLAAHRHRQALATIALFHAPDLSQCGIARLSSDGLIVGFEEKPEYPAGDLANAGIYALSTRIFDYLGGATPCDFARDVFPRLVAQGAAVFGWEIEGYHLDVGTPAALAQAQRDAATWPRPGGSQA